MLKEKANCDALFLLRGLDYVIRKQLQNEAVEIHHIRLY